MMDFIADRLNNIALICFLLSIAVPITINYINFKYHQLTDPKWKKEEDEQSKSNQQ
ncbi:MULTISPECIES: hypothetical protein [Oceanobacillus]|nr:MULTISPECIES: hypothetical protein [Oceanobacillus]MBT2600622.1 hypothetical protein [Oceanobacillus sp. ISL-74]MBT2650981.1 hypothetical protein [Oceanobacillus sp. ISL-73]